MDADKQYLNQTLGGGAMFSLNEAITRWKNKTLSYGKCSDEDLDELESHLLEHFEELRDSGLSEEEAFSQAITRMGAPEDVSREFSKIPQTLRIKNIKTKKTNIVSRLEGLSTELKNSCGMGAFVGVPFFLLIYFGQMFGPMDLIGSVGTAFGCSFGVAMCSYVLTRKKAPDGALKT